MIAVESGHPKGTVGVAQGELARYTDFDISLDSLYVPVGTTITRVKGPSVSRNRNTLALEYFQGEWLFFVDDDQVLRRDTLLRLLAHNVDIVGALYSTKHPPFIPTVFKDELEPGKLYRHAFWSALGASRGLTPCVAVGTGAMLVRRRVFETIPKPWFHWGQGESDDVFFCRKAREHGFKIHVDTNAVVGHASTNVIWPDLDDPPGVAIQMNWLAVKLPNDDDAAAEHVFDQTLGREGEPQ